MSQSLARILVHAIFSTKDRTNYLSNEIIKKLYPYIMVCLKNQGCFAHAVGGTENHIHILFEMTKNQSICKVIEKIKTSSSIAIKKMAENLNDFHWQHGYGIFSVSCSNLAVVAKYIENQIKHHQKFSFEEELRLFLKKNLVNYDEKYLWN
jgi:putative transposase